MSEIEIRPPMPEEMSAVRALRFNELYQAMLGWRQPEEDDPVDHLETTIHMAAIDRGAVVGTLRIEGRPEDGHYLNLFATARDRREEGLGTQIYSAAEDTARLNGISHLTLHALGGTARFYKKLGYKRTGRRMIGLSTRRPYIAIAPEMEKKL